MVPKHWFPTCAPNLRGFTKGPHQYTTSRQLLFNDVATHIGTMRDTNLATGASASQVLASANDLEGQASTLRSRVDSFLVNVRAG